MSVQDQDTAEHCLIRLLLY